AIVDGPDPEARWRAELILSKRAERPDPLPEAALHSIHYLEITGLAADVTAALPALELPHLRRAAAQALVATATADDAPLLRRLLKSPHEDLQLAGIQSLAAALGPACRDDLRSLHSAESVALRLAVADALARVGDRDALPALAELLADASVDVRAQAAALLRAATNQQFGFVAYDEPARRDEAVARWRSWIPEHGATVDLAPLADALAKTHEIGHTLVLVYSRGLVMELDSEGNTVWQRDGLNYPWACQKLANGNVLVGSYRGQFAAEYDRDGKEVWRKDGLPGGVFGIERLPNGNTLMGMHKSGEVVEVDHAGETVWRQQLGGNPMDVARLPNGNTLVTLSTAKKVVEIDRAGKVTWELNGLVIPRTAQRLPNGNTLVADMGSRKVAEYDRAGRLVWELPNIRAYDAQRLANGNTLYADASGVHIVDRDGKIVWQKNIPGAGRAVRF
ncbi:MAG: PQQ-binding-like beta-propeller repeat protein, partial [Planctomycetales bacterium]|nr:PQQ-binding-like beta-propeller repeat protein [Planctomycetales bacterium]